MRLVEGVPGWRGFDANCEIGPDTARSLVQHGYRFALRYVPRQTAHAGDLSACEVDALVAAGLCVMAVQHVESAERWIPSARKGELYGATAADAAAACGLLPGTHVWCDLEGVAVGTPHAETIAYLKAWHQEVADRGFRPGLYVGWHCGLTPVELYRSLPFAAYWGAYNLNADERPAVRGLALQQQVCGLGDKPPECRADFDVNIMRRDNLGGIPMLTGPAA